MWYELSQVGVNIDRSWRQNRHTILCNRISLILSFLTLLTTLIGLGYFGWMVSVQMGLVAAIIFITPVLLNKFNLINTSRFVLSILLSTITMIVSVFDKFDIKIQLEEFQYFQFRLVLLLAGIFPFMLYSLSERKYWITALTYCFLCVILYDPVHEAFGAGYYQLGLKSPNYYFVNYMVAMTFIIFSGSIYFLKKSFEEYEMKNEVLIKSFQAANETIREQREMLAKENLNLNNELVNANDQLVQTNQELIRHNNDLMQFSYSVSHNLRAPVASLIGLFQLLEKPSSQDEFQHIFNHMSRSIGALDQIIKDLSSIIDIRNTVAEIKQRVIFEEEVDKIKSLLEKQISDYEVNIITDFQNAPDLLSIRPMMSSVLYNLISNAIKYRSPDRLPEIRMTTSQNKGFLKLVVSDNGLGIDLQKHGSKLFGLYKRFHTHTEGRGLGLFLVKLQVEALEGGIDVQSELDRGTIFTLHFKIPDGNESTHPPTSE